MGCYKLTYQKNILEVTKNYLKKELTSKRSLNKDYSKYLFGMPQPGRTFNEGEYRYSFNGMENEGKDWTSSNGSHLDFGARIYDSRLGRWLSLDPLQAKYPGISPYNFALDNPIIFIDPDGEDAKLSIDVEKKTITLETTVFLYGPDASEKLANDLNTRWNNIEATTKVVNDEGIEWTVTIKQQYKYVGDNISTKLSVKYDDKIQGEIDKGTNFNQANGKTLDYYVYLRPEDAQEMMNEIGFSPGDNLMQVDASLEITVGGVTSGSGTRNVSKVGRVRFDAFLHETGHHLGFDERYIKLSGFAMTVPGFKGDMMGTTYIDNVNDQHFIDLYLYSKEILKGNGNQSIENKTFNQDGSDSKIDDTENGESVKN